MININIDRYFYSSFLEKGEKFINKDNDQYNIFIFSHDNWLIVELLWDMIDLSIWMAPELDILNQYYYTLHAWYYLKKKNNSKIYNFCFKIIRLFQNSKTSKIIKTFLAGNRRNHVNIFIKIIVTQNIRLVYLILFQTLFIINLYLIITIFIDRKKFSRTHYKPNKTQENNDDLIEDNNSYLIN